MNIETILADLEHNSGKFPTEAVEAALAAGPDLAPALRAVIARGPAAIDAEGDTYMLHVYACYLLAVWRDAAALDPILKFFSGQGSLAADLFGDFVTADLHRVLAGVCRGREDDVAALAETAGADEWVRGAAIRAFVAMFAAGELAREAVIERLRGWLTGGLPAPEFGCWTGLLTACCDLGAKELAAEIEAAYAAGWIPEDGLPLSEVLQEIKRPPDAGAVVGAAEHHQLITDPIAAMSWWACFQEDDDDDFMIAPAPVPTVAVSQPGRNDACPCGSGRKYKKCCLNRDEESYRPGQLAPLWTSKSPAIDRPLAMALDIARDEGPAAACGPLLEGWRQLARALDASVTSLYDFDVRDDRAYGGVFDLADLCHESLSLFESAAAEDPATAADGLAFCRLILARFPDEHRDNAAYFRTAIGVFHFHTGDVATGEQVLRDLIAEDPRRTIGYAYLAEALGETDYHWHTESALDLPRAIATLEEALALPVDDGDDFDLELRLRDLKRRLN